MSNNVWRLCIVLLLLFANMLLLVAQPRVSIITSVYKGDLFIQGFLEDIVQQTIFDQCELIIINANSPGHEEPPILKYQKKYPNNIRYIRLTKDPGLYAVWNMGIQMAQAELLTNANIDDRRNPCILEVHASYLEQHQDVDLVYSDFYISFDPNISYKQAKSRCRVQRKKSFSKKAMQGCLPGPQPMWRKSLHDKYGLFDETLTIVGDWEMWLRAVNGGALFRRVSTTSGVYYQNPIGVSTQIASLPKRFKEERKLKREYGHLWKGG